MMSAIEKFDSKDIRIKELEDAAKEYAKNGHSINCACMRYIFIIVDCDCGYDKLVKVLEGGTEQ